MQPTDKQADASFDSVENLSEFSSHWLAGRKPSAVFVLCDRNTRKHCLPLLEGGLPQSREIIEIPKGEENKTLDTCMKVWEYLSRKNADRNALLINLGGGVIGDLGGFCAATYKRGIGFVQVPTTLLAMVDASLGGKTGIDFKGFKNQIGAFAMPEAVWIHTPFLQTLPSSELLSGFAEVIKHALISDAPAWNQIRKTELENQPWEILIPASLKVKKAIVETDPFERSDRKKLNAGHTLGHALESHLINTGRGIPHGHCVAAGLVMESRIAVEKGLLAEWDLIRIEELIYTLFGKAPINRKDIPAIVRLCRQDKKNQGGTVLLSTVGPIGSCGINVPASETDLKLALRYYLG